MHLLPGPYDNQHLLQNALGQGDNNINPIDDAVVALEKLQTSGPDYYVMVRVLSDCQAKLTTPLVVTASAASFVEPPIC
jgi:hypothetical protein